MSEDFFYRPPGPKRPPRTRPLGAQAQARLDAAASPLPIKGDEITIRWPGGPYDFVMHFIAEDRSVSAAPGWHFLLGSIVSPQRWHPNPWSPLVRLVDGEWSLVPVGHRITEDGSTVPIH